MPNPYFQFKQFTIQQDRCAMKVTTDGCLFGAWASEAVGSQESGPDSYRIRSLERVLDIGAGTGLLSLMLAQKVKAIVDAIEIDRDAFEQAKENADASPWKDRIHIYHADARQFSFPNKYDIIISNPPFYENELRSPDEKKNIAHHGGLGLIELFQIISDNLQDGGQFFLLLPAKRAVEAGLLLSKYDFQITKTVMVRQSTQHDYFRIMIQGQHTSYETNRPPREEMAIWNQAKEYTPEFIALLKDYYVYL